MLKVNIGDSAPTFCLPDKDGNEICLENYKGKWVILYFYPKDLTSGCTIQAIDFTASLPEFDKMNTVVLGVSPDSPKSHQKFVDKHELKVLLLSDEEKTVLEAYGAWGEKSMYGKTHFGVTRSTVVIDPEGKVAETWNKVKAAGHIDSVKEKLKELQS
ncbi:MAG: thioredoxin-dependent thiol peroxidase [Candidatus Heimdallarchaeota archaeon]|nr:thioredoxin-dependent thiol peroxidase [Candidatus Heimdallarchaeota archaeon]MCG3252249.1 thioredoxin-dependent thiol peroxidase [Candidatus Heimdallarchaeota archaeon]MCK4289387.1 thioredoxin-dependent thiol peroxidase [Candidatus Heimdallarchaeota archaeon]